MLNLTDWADINDSLAYLELEKQDVPKDLFNPFNEMQYARYVDEPAEEVVKLLLDKNYLHFALKY